MQSADPHFQETREVDIQMEGREEKLLDVSVNEKEALVTTSKLDIQNAEGDICSQKNVVHIDKLSSEQDFSVSRYMAT